MPALDDPVALAYPVVGVGQVPAELEQAVALYRQKKPRRVLEIGVWYGGTLREWLRHAVPTATVVAVDIDHLNPDAYEEWRKDDTNLIVLTGSSLDDEVRQQIAEQGPYDWVFIDGEHAEQYVDADVGFALSIASPGATILLHDIDPGGSGTTGPRAVFARLQLQGLETSTFVEPSEGTGYPQGSAHGIGVVYL